METLDLKCTCKGCRNWRQTYQFSYAERIAELTNGHYFSPSTMRFFKSRILGWRTVVGINNYDGLLVRESSAGDMDNTYRVYRWVLFCPYGELVERGENHLSSRALTKELETLSAGDVLARCECHGCQLDRAGR